MPSFFQWFGRIVFLLMIAAFAAAGFVLWRFEEWKGARVAALEKASRVVNTAAGEIEYAIQGKGPPILICHGAPGGWDQGVLLGEPFVKSGFAAIAPSRPGFLRTPLATGLTFADQADALAALLDFLEIDRVGVLGFSSGAEVAALFALRHPNRTTALALVSPITTAYVPDGKTAPHPIEAALMELTGDVGSWLMLKLARARPADAAQLVLENDSTMDDAARRKLATEIAGDPERARWLQEFAETLAPLSPRESGSRNDLLMMRNLRRIPFEKIGLPILIVEGEKDAAARWVDLASVDAVNQKAVVCNVADSGHLVWLSPKAVALQETLIAFFRSAAAAPSSN